MDKAILILLAIIIGIFLGKTIHAITKIKKGF